MFYVFCICWLSCSLYSICFWRDLILSIYCYKLYFLTSSFIMTSHTSTLSIVWLNFFEAWWFLLALITMFCWSFSKVFAWGDRLACDVFFKISSIALVWDSFREFLFLLKMLCLGSAFGWDEGFWLIEMFSLPFPSCLFRSSPSAAISAFELFKSSFYSSGFRFSVLAFGSFTPGLLSWASYSI